MKTRISEINKHKINITEYNYFKKSCMSDPFNQLFYSSFIEAYEELINKNEKKVEDENELLIYQKLKWLNDSRKWCDLNKIGKIYLNSSKFSLAFMCFVESLRQNPNQQDIFEITIFLRKKQLEKNSIKLPKTACMVSIIMPTYNRCEQIRESIQSVLSQTYEDYELLVINDGGDNKVKAVVESFCSPKIKYQKLSKNKGLSGALNEGIIRAKGKYIAYLDDDDIYYPTHLETLVNFFEKNSHYDLAYTNAWWCYGNQKNSKFHLTSKKLNKVRPNTFNRDLFYQQNYISTLNVMHKKKCIKEIGLFNEDLGSLADWDMWKRFAKKYDFHQINKITGEYRWHTENKTNRNYLEVAFLYRILKSYYLLGCGEIAFLKAYMQQNNKQKSKQLYDDLLKSYKIMPKSPLLVEEMFEITQHFEKSKHRLNVTRDYFRMKPRGCIKGLLKNRNSYELLYTIDLIFPALVNLLKRKVSNKKGI